MAGFNQRTLVGAICASAKADPQGVYEVLLSSGHRIEGELSPVDDQTDYIRVNPVPTNKNHSIYVSVSHIVSMQRKP